MNLSGQTLCHSTVSVVGQAQLLVVRPVCGANLKADLSMPPMLVTNDAPSLKLKTIRELPSDDTFLLMRKYEGNMRV